MIFRQKYIRLPHKHFLKLLKEIYSKKCFSQDSANYPIYSVRQLLEASVPETGVEAVVNGWISGHRRQKDNTFVDIVDGSCFKHLQVVVKSDHVQAESILFGSSVRVEGELRLSTHPKQRVEMHCREMRVVGANDTLEYPIKVKMKHDGEYLRNEGLTHRHRTNAGAAMLKIRNRAMLAYHEAFQSRGFLHVNAPVLTANDCEGAGEVFQVKATDDGVLDEDGKPKQFFKKDVFLTVSGQLHLEALVHGLSKVYTFGPTFRADNTTSRFHLSEFYMIEAEQAFLHSVAEIQDLIEQILKGTTESILNGCEEDIDLYHKYIAKPRHKSNLEKFLKEKFETMTYTEAAEILGKSNQFPEFQWGNDLGKEMERFLVSHVGNGPLFIVDFPKSLKPFYAKGNGDGKTSASLDLLLPDVGEVCGGTLREHDYDSLVSNMKSRDIPSCDDLVENKLKWYCDLRRFGSVPHGGFGIGFERHLMFLTGVSNLRDCIPFPRSDGKCNM